MPVSSAAAWAIDYVIQWAPTLTPIIAAVYILEKTNSSQGQIFGGSLIALGVISGLFILGYNWYLIATRGQTIAKRWLKLKIVRENGKPVDFKTGVALRSWITFWLSGPWLSWLGCLFFIAQAASVAMYVIGFTEALTGSIPGLGWSPVVIASIR